MTGSVGKCLFYHSLEASLWDNSVKNLQKSKKDNTFLEEWIEEDGKPVLVEQWGTADLSKHWFEAPKHFLDFERFLDYKNLLEPEYYKKEAETPPKPAPYKIHEGKEYTKEEWQQYQEEKRKNARPGTTWSLLDD